MDIGIIGLGAVGLFISSKLSERHDVTGYVRNQKQLNEIRENGIQINKDRYQIRVKTIERLQKHDLIIICVKQPHLAYLMPILNSLDKTCLLFIQNGLSHIQMIQELNHFIMLGVCEHGVSKVNSHQVQLNGLGQIKVGDFQEHNDAKDVQHQLYASDFPVFYDDDIIQTMNEKVIVNSVINPLTALFDIENGQVITNPYLKEIAYQLSKEASEVLEMNCEKSWKKVQEVAHNTKNNVSSMLVDIRMKRTTEIESINGYIVKQSKIDVPTQSNMYHLIKAKEINH